MIVSATPETVEDVLKDLVNDPERRRELGERGRAFALKFHSAQAGARRMDQVYRELLTIMLANPRTIDQATRLLWVAHNLERVADRA